jgi:hypothetical protein
MQKVTTPKQVQVIRTWMFNKIDRVCFQVRSSKSEDIYHTCFDKGHASCTCPAGAKSCICYHVTQLRPRYEASRQRGKQRSERPIMQASTPAWWPESRAGEAVHLPKKGIFKMIIKVNQLSDTAAARGFRIDAVWHNGVICFELVRLSDEVIVLETVGTMDIERYFLEH